MNEEKPTTVMFPVLNPETLEVSEVEVDANEWWVRASQIDPDEIRVSLAEMGPEPLE